MGMNSSTMKIVAGALVVLAVVFAFVGFRMSRNYAQNAQGEKQAAAQAPAAPQTLVVIATKPLFANQPIAKDAVALVPVTVAPTDYFANLDDVAGRTPLVDVDAGAPITPRFFKETNVLAKLIPAGDQAISLELNDVLGVGNFVHSGDVVDVLVYLKNDSSNRIDPAQARVLLKDALVLAYDERITTPVKDSKQDDAAAQARAAQAGGRHQRTVVIAVPEAEVTRVMLGASLGDLRLALHGLAPGEAAAAGNDSAASALPLSDQAQAKARQAAPTDKVITSAELAAIKPLNKGGGIQIYRGNQHVTVYP